MLYSGDDNIDNGKTHTDKHISNRPEFLNHWCPENKAMNSSGTVDVSDNINSEKLCEWDTEEFEDGEYQIRLAARDAAGNRSLAHPADSENGSVHIIKVTVDNKDPEVDAGSNATVIDDQTYSLNGNVTEEENVYDVKWTLTGAPDEVDVNDFDGFVDEEDEEGSETTFGNDDTGEVESESTQAMAWFNWWWIAALLLLGALGCLAYSRRGQKNA